MLRAVFTQLLASLVAQVVLVERRRVRLIVLFAVDLNWCSTQTSLRDSAFRDDDLSASRLSRSLARQLVVRGATRARPRSLLALLALLLVDAMLDINSRILATPIVDVERRADRVHLSRLATLIHRPKVEHPVRKVAETVLSAGERVGLSTALLTVVRRGNQLHAAKSPSVTSSGCEHWVRRQLLAHIAQNFAQVRSQSIGVTRLVLLIVVARHFGWTSAVALAFAIHQVQVSHFIGLLRIGIGAGVGGRLATALHALALGATEAAGASLRVHLHLFTAVNVLRQFLEGSGVALTRAFDVYLLSV